MMKDSTTQKKRHFIGRVLCCLAVLADIFPSISQAAVPMAAPSALLEYTPPPPADTADDNLFKPYVAASLMYDSNLLRLPNSVTPQQAAGNAVAAGTITPQQAAGINTKSSFVKQLTAGLNMDWKLSQQHLILKANVNQNWFSTYGMLDYLGHDIQAQWNWRITRKLNGNLGYINTTSMGSYAMINVLINNVYTRDDYFANGSYEVIPEWFFRGGFRRYAITFPVSAARQISNTNANVGEIGLEHIDTDKNRLGFSMQRIDGNYPGRSVNASAGIDNAYLKNNYNLNWDWFYSVKTELRCQLGYTQVQWANLTSYDFSGITANASLTWRATEKTILLLSAWRNYSLWNTLTTSFVLVQGIQMDPSWIIAPKIRVNLPLSYQVQSFLGNPGVVSAPATSSSEVDQVYDAGLNLVYSPLENTKIILFIQYENRNSNNNPSHIYTDESLGMNMQVAF
jgi:exopolysaccharide biosynthesis operon protein EpsL